MSRAKGFSQAELLVAEILAKALPLYLQQTKRIQQIIQEMGAIINDDSAEEQEKSMAVSTIAEAIFPGPDYRLERGHHAEK